MEKFRKGNLQNIQALVQMETGTVITADKRSAGSKFGRRAVLAGTLLCFMAFCAFAYAKFSGLNGDEAGFAAVYQGDGRYEIIIVNDSDRELKLQDKVKVMQWSTGREIEGEPDKIRMEVSAIGPHSHGSVCIDLSEAYDIGKMEQNLTEGDWYYFVLTNNDFAFGQDWMCGFDFKTERTEEVKRRLFDGMKERKEREEERELTARQQHVSENLVYPEWTWPAVSRDVSLSFGRQENGTYSDHVNIAGASGDEIYAVADGVVTEAAFETACGNVIVVDIGDGVTVKYGHLKEIKVSEGEEIKQGQVIASLGQTGMATGPNLLFAVIVDGEAVDPLGAE